MRIVATSDTHNRHEDVVLPPGESMPYEVAEMFTMANDQHGLTFKQIAEVVREVWL